MKFRREWILTNYFIRSLIITRDSNKFFHCKFNLFWDCCTDTHLVLLCRNWAQGVATRLVNGYSMLQIRLLNHITWQPVMEFSHHDVILDSDCTVHQECLAREDPSKVSCKSLLKIIVACVCGHQHCSFLVPIRLHMMYSVTQYTDCQGNVYCLFGTQFKRITCKVFLSLLP
jgi:hypothetical protein